MGTRGERKAGGKGWRVAAALVHAARANSWEPLTSTPSLPPPPTSHTFLPRAPETQPVHALLPARHVQGLCRGRPRRGSGHPIRPLPTSSLHQRPHPKIHLRKPRTEGSNLGLLRTKQFSRIPRPTTTERPPAASAAGRGRGAASILETLEAAIRSQACEPTRAHVHFITAPPQPTHVPRPLQAQGGVGRSPQKPTALVPVYHLPLWPAVTSHTAPTSTWSPSQLAGRIRSQPEPGT